MQVVILAAGMGTRLGREGPKALTVLADGRTILGRQLDAVARVLPGATVTLVVGFQADVLAAASPGSALVHNPDFATTNTSVSLRLALEQVGPGAVLWLNGDVVLEPEVLERVVAAAGERSVVAVNTAAVGEEEVKYQVDDAGYVSLLSKQVSPALGEAVGVNLVSATDRDVLARRLAEVGPQDYFERGIEVAVAEDGLRFVPVDVSDLVVMEVDFAEDLERANTLVTEESRRTPR